MGEHRFLVFTQHPNNDREELREIRRDIKELKKRHVKVGRTLDWNLLDRLVARGHIDCYLSQKFPTGNLSFNCNAWRRTLNMKEPIYKELVIEFIALYEFDEDLARGGYGF